MDEHEISDREVLRMILLNTLYEYNSKAKVEDFMKKVSKEKKEEKKEEGADHDLEEEIIETEDEYDTALEQVD